MAEQFTPVDALGPQNLTSRISAQPGKKKAPMQAAPTLAPPTPPQNFFDAILQAIAQTGPGFMAKAESLFNTRMPQIDAQISAMKKNNAVQAQNLNNLQLGAEALDAAPPPAVPIAPTDLFGPPKAMPAPVERGAPSPQSFMQQHNARTPKKAAAAEAPQKTAQLPPTPAAFAPAPTAMSQVQQTALQPDKRTQLILEAMGQVAAVEAAKNAAPLKTNWLQTPNVPPRRGARQ